MKRRCPGEDGRKEGRRQEGFLPAATALACLLISGEGAFASESDPFYEKILLFPKEGKTVHRIPSIVATRDGALLAFADRRKGSHGDWGHDTDIVLRRSADGGRTWQPVQTLASEPGVNFHGGPALVDRRTGRAFKFFKKRPASFRDAKQFHAAMAAETGKWKEWGVGSYVTHSDDGGATWSAPRRVPVDHPDSMGIADVGNNVHGVQLADGRLVIQGYCQTSRGWEHDRDNPSRSFLLVSEDKGGTWRRGAEWSPGYAAMEYGLLATEDGGLYVNQRSLGPRRKVAWIKGPDAKNVDLKEDPHLPEPVCHAGLERLSTRKEHGRSRILFVNPAVENATKRYQEGTRRRLMVRLSYDEGRTWPVARVLEEGKAGYADLAVLKDGTILCLFENGPERYDDQISVSRFNLEWLTEGREPADRRE